MVPLVFGRKIRSHFLSFVESHLRFHEQVFPCGAEDILWDVIIVGAGPHGATCASKIKSIHPNAKVLLIEGRDVSSGHFANGGQYFRINSTLNQPDPGPCFESTGKYNHPHVFGPIQVTDLSGHRWPSASMLAQLSKYSLFDSAVNIIYQQQVKEVHYDTEGGHYILQSDRGNRFNARQLVISTGLGKPVTPHFKSDALGMNFIAVEIEKTETTTYLSRDNCIVTVAQALRRVRVADPMGEWRALDDGLLEYPIVLVGFGNSAFTFMEFMHSLGPDEGYLYERVQKGMLPGKLPRDKQELKLLIAYLFYLKYNQLSSTLAAAIVSQKLTIKKKPVHGMLIFLHRSSPAASNFRMAT